MLIKQKFQHVNYQTLKQYDKNVQYVVFFMVNNIVRQSILIDLNKLSNNPPNYYLHTGIRLAHAGNSFRKQKSKMINRERERERER